MNFSSKTAITHSEPVADRSNDAAMAYFTQVQMLAGKLVAQHEQLQCCLTVYFLFHNDKEGPDRIRTVHVSPIVAAAFNQSRSDTETIKLHRFRLLGFEVNQCDHVDVRVQLTFSRLGDVRPNSEYEFTSVMKRVVLDKAKPTEFWMNIDDDTSGCYNSPMPWTVEMNLDRATGEFKADVRNEWGQHLNLCSAIIRDAQRDYMEQADALIRRQPYTPPKRFSESTVTSRQILFDWKPKSDKDMNE